MKGLIFTYALTYGGAAVSIFNPWYGLLIYIAFAILRPEALWHWSVPRGDYSLIVALSFLAGWAIHGFGSWNLGRAKPVLYCLLAFWILLLFQIVISPQPAVTQQAVIQLSKIFLPVVAGLSMLDSVARLKQLAWTIVAAQGYLAFEFNLMYYQSPMFNSEEWSFAGLDNNGLAISLCSTIGLAFFLGFVAVRWWQKLIALSSAGLMTHVVLFSMSRGGMLALVITGGVTFFLVPKRPKDSALFALGIIIALNLAGPSVREEFSTVFVDKEQRDASSAKRVEHWLACADAIEKHPLTGVGFERWGQVAPQYGLPEGMEAHSTWLQLTAELGLPGILAIMGFYWTGVVRLWPFARDRIRAVDPFINSTARMVIASFVGFFVSACFVSVEGIEPPYYVMLLGAGALRLAAAPEPSPAAAIRKPQPDNVLRPLGTKRQAITHAEQH